MAMTTIVRTPEGHTPVIGLNEIARPSSFELAVDFTTMVTAPVFATLTILPITTLRATSFLKFTYTGNWIHTGPFAGNVAFNVRFLLDGVLLQGGATDNKVRSQIGGVARTGRRPVVAGPHSITVEVTKFGGVGNTLAIRPGTLPDLMHAALIIKEQI